MMLELAVVALPSGLTRLLEKPPLWVTAWGYILLLLVAIELMVGYRRFNLAPLEFRRIHPALAWALALLVLPHAALGVAHVVVLHLFSVAPGVHVHVGASPENLPIWLDIEGLVILVLLALQIMAGNRAFKLNRQQFLGLHATLAWSIAAFVVLHAALGAAHTLTG